ncbi:hypothetical protein P7C73_g2047, partial [Tremellales sp. Uapishka_1]
MAEASTRPRLNSMKSSASSMNPGWNRPPSPTYSATTTGSRVNLSANHMLITRKDLRQSIACFEELMAAAKAYRNALLAMSSATAAFAAAMEACSRVKGCHSSNAALAGSAGLQFLTSNHEQILADGVYRQFEIPLLEALDNYKREVAERLAIYENGMQEQSNRIRKTEAENLKVGRRRKRDLQSFRLALAELQRQVDELDGLKARYHEEVLEGEDEVWEIVTSKLAFVVRSQLDFYEKIASKASDPIIEPLIMSIPDPYDSYGPPREDGQIFSVLAPLGLLDSSSPSSPTPALTRTQTSSASTTPGDRSPTKKGLSFPASVAYPSLAEAVAIEAVGEYAEVETDVNRARRELSIIEEKESNSMLNADDVDGAGALLGESEAEGSGEDKDSPSAEEALTSPAQRNSGTDLVSAA